jgi:hypothetical protein
MGASYIPAKDNDLLPFCQNVDVLVTASPAVYALGAGDALVIHAATAAFATALTLATDPSTRTPATVSAKDGAKAAVVAIMRDYLQTIKTNLGITNDVKIGLGIHIDDTTKTPVPTPTTQPLLGIVGALPNQMTFRYTDPGSGKTRAKPAGALGMQFYVFIGDVVPSDPLEFRFAEFVTTQPFVINFDPADKGKKATFIGRWQTRTGDVGPWSGLVSMTIAG